jgi:hypothetical protein
MYMHIKGKGNIRETAPTQEIELMAPETKPGILINQN